MDVLSDILSVEQRWIITASLGILSVVGVAAILTRRSRAANVPELSTPWYLPGIVATLMRGRDMLVESAVKYPGKMVKMPMFPFGTIYIANGEKLVEEIRSTPDDVFDFPEFGRLFVQFKYTIGPEANNAPYHFQLIKTTLTRRLNGLFPGLVDEIESSFDDIFALEGNEWKAFTAHSTMLDIVARVSNRILVGTPLCRNEEFLRLAKDFTIDVFASSYIINLFPQFLEPVIGFLVGKGPRYRRAVAKTLESTVQDRLAGLDAYGLDWAEKPNDFLAWMLENDYATSTHPPMEYIAQKLLHINFVALHSSAGTFTHMLLSLATFPEYQDILRKEVEGCIAEDGWTKDSMQKMRRVDSFLRETMRVHGMVGTSIHRKVLKDYTFSDGTFVRKGSWIAASVYAAHMDPNVYPNPETFDPWRFYDIREASGEDSSHVSTATGSQFLGFGYGGHACTGRFFATNELKAMLAFLVLGYDVKLEDSAAAAAKERPANLYLGVNCVPNAKARVMIRRRI